MPGRWRHPTEADWAAYLGSELDARTRSELRRHLERCPRCQGTLERVDAIAGLVQAPVPEPDELSWRRMEARLEAAQGESGRFSIDLPRGAAALSGDTRTVDLIRGRRWLLAGLAAAGVVAAFIMFTPRRAPSPPAPRTAATSARSGIVRSGAAPLGVELGSGVRLELASFSELALPAPDEAPPRIDLDHGRLDVWAPRALPGRPTSKMTVLVRTPELRLWARSRDFSVAYQAGRHRVEVREGTVDVEGEGVSERLERGEARAFEQPWSGPAEPELAILRRLREAPTSSRSKAAPSAPPPAARPGPRPEPPTPAAPTPRPAPPAETGSRVLETKVERLQPVVDEGAERALAEARRAWLEDRDAARASKLAGRAIELSDDPTLERAALELRCDARVSLGRGEAAVRACRALLDRERDPERRRRVHYTLASIYRRQLDDCGAAIPHYGKALVFGRRSRFDDAVRLRRAECALEAGDLAMARTDLDRLSEGSADPERLRRARAKLLNLEEEARYGTRDAE